MPSTSSIQIPKVTNAPGPASAPEPAEPASAPEPSEPASAPEPAEPVSAPGRATPQPATPADRSYPATPFAPTRRRIFSEGSTTQQVPVQGYLANLRAASAPKKVASVPSEFRQNVFVAEVERNARSNRERITQLRTRIDDVTATIDLLRLEYEKTKNNYQKLYERGLGKLVTRVRQQFGLATQLRAQALPSGPRSSSVARDSSQ
ncbi:hypothetical protein L227DRAFT_567943 [Lentinus tigrinus ALCF2SS1-6]|uniref:Uncharacterized protein n=1 Tax=Lentinus tigrinus ALCF2SS1-6 TaxID=1328759 RepID=A0A5C2RSN2_9APHY|nr:hypothetical protein L227DRAFT_567943 [Lentinus tigrinus ALCF2SS1-6]